MNKKLLTYIIVNIIVIIIGIFIIIKFVPKNVSDRKEDLYYLSTEGIQNHLTKYIYDKYKVNCDLSFINHEHDKGSDSLFGIPYCYDVYKFNGTDDKGRKFNIDYIKDCNPSKPEKIRENYQNYYSAD